MSNKQIAAIGVQNRALRSPGQWGWRPLSHPEPHRSPKALHRLVQDVEVPVATPFHALLLPWAAFGRAGKTGDTAQRREGGEEEIRVEPTALAGQGFPEQRRKA